MALKSLGNNAPIRTHRRGVRGQRTRDKEKERLTKDSFALWMAAEHYSKNKYKYIYIQYIHRNISVNLYYSDFFKIHNHLLNKLLFIALC